jgi:parallel beta-helix repeat protein
VIERNVLKGNGTNGLGLAVSRGQTPDRNQLRRNVMTDNAGSGLIVRGEQNVATDNRFNDNANGVLLLEGAHDNVIRGNEMTDNTQYGLLIRCANLEVAFCGPIADPFANVIEDNELEDNATLDARDDTTGAGDFGTANQYDDNDCDDSDPEEICD